MGIESLHVLGPVSVGLESRAVYRHARMILSVIALSTWHDCRSVLLGLTVAPSADGDPFERFYWATE